MVAHLPASGKPAPRSTYRLQLHAGFTFADAARICDYLAELGVSHVYCSPYLAATPGSVHGYDVVDFGRLNDELGGAAGFERLVQAARAAGLGLVLDVVPNHMSVECPQDNRWWWDVLARGQHSPYAEFFDIDWARHDGTVLLPVLGDDTDAVHRVGDEIVYHDKRFPAARAYQLAHWRRGRDELNYRRFFDVSTLAGVRVERPEVFDATHALVLDQVKAGILDGLRIDHPDGLADPAGYLDRLRAATGGSWVVVEKILEGDETLPADWACAGTTGYDALNQLLGVLVDPRGEPAFTDLYRELTGEPASFDTVVEQAKRLVVDEVLAAEVSRLVRAAGVPALRAALVELLVAFPVYRAYVTPGVAPDPTARAQLDEAATQAKLARPDLAAEVDHARELAVSGPPDFVVRFQQTCGPVMAKGVEDTAFYRYHRLVALNEVGGDPRRFGRSVADFHAFCARLQADWPLTMTTLSTHDTKRGEHTRARLAALSEQPAQWGQAVRKWMAHRPAPDANLGYLAWQTLVGAWPLERDRALRFLTKAAREAKQHTSWTDPDPAYDAALGSFVDGIYADADLLADVQSFAERLAPAGRVNELTQKLLQLTMPGVPDVYQGSELETLTLVDPDNRRPVDYPTRRRLLAAQGEGLAEIDPTGRVVQRLTAQALRLRGRHPEWFDPWASYHPLQAHGASAAHLLGFSRADRVVTLTTRLSVGLDAGWGDTSVRLPANGRWTDLLTGATLSTRADAQVPVAALLVELPVALLVRD